MKTTLFLNDYEGSTYDDVINSIIIEYQVEKQEILKYHILIAQVCRDGYEESSYFLLIRNDGKIFENFGSHCSCFGFENQFEPKETDIAYLLSEHYDVGYCVKDRSKIRNFLCGLIRRIKIEQIKERIN